MYYSMYLLFAAAPLGRKDSVAEPPKADLRAALSPALERFRQLLEKFGSKQISPQAAFELEQQVRAELRELGRAGVECAYNHVEPSQTDVLPAHVEFEAGLYTRNKHKTPQAAAEECLQRTLQAVHSFEFKR